MLSKNICRTVSNCHTAVNHMKSPVRLLNFDMMSKMKETLVRENFNKDGSKTATTVIQPSRISALKDESHATIDFEMGNGKTKAMSINLVRELIAKSGSVPVDLKPATRADAEILEELLQSTKKVKK